jgi:hypothetical protein
MKFYEFLFASICFSTETFFVISTQRLPPEPPQTLPGVPQEMKSVMMNKGIIFFILIFDFNLHVFQLFQIIPLVG